MICYHRSLKPVWVAWMIDSVSAGLILALKSLRVVIIVKHVDQERYDEAITTHYEGCFSVILRAMICGHSHQTVITRSSKLTGITSRTLLIVLFS